MIAEIDEGLVGQPRGAGMQDGKPTVSGIEDTNHIASEVLVLVLFGRLAPLIARTKGTGG